MDIDIHVAFLMHGYSILWIREEELDMFVKNAVEEIAHCIHDIND